MVNLTNIYVLLNDFYLINECTDVVLNLALYLGNLDDLKFFL